MKTHLNANGQAACGSFNTKFMTMDHLSVTCSRCQRAITSAARTGRMINEE